MQISLKTMGSILQITNRSGKPYLLTYFFILKKDKILFAFKECET